MATVYGRFSHPPRPILPPDRGLSQRFEAPSSQVLAQSPPDCIFGPACAALHAPRAPSQGSRCRLIPALPGASGRARRRARPAATHQFPRVVQPATLHGFATSRRYIAETTPASGDSASRHRSVVRTHIIEAIPASGASGSRHFTGELRRSQTVPQGNSTRLLPFNQRSR